MSVYQSITCRKNRNGRGAPPIVGVGLNVDHYCLRDTSQPQAFLVSVCVRCCGGMRNYIQQQHSLKKIFFSLFLGQTLVEKVFN